MAEQKLTIKQKKFADEYVKTGNATDAAIKAGYSEKYAHTNANKLLQNTTIKARIDAQMQKLEDDKIMKADEALRLITAIARGEETTTVETQEGYELTVYPTITEKQRASEAILKRYPLSPLDKAQINKAQADAVKAEAEANLAKAQAEQLHTVADKTREKMDKLSTEELRNLAKLAGEKDD
ncbi:terminase small subunit [Lactobacillus crispatus]|uniref:terminase small subunit n=1 Tax=Lactobacillus crispatus TaxID=47770 RepID=UPI00105B7F14|nr:terminase small subunit [Lactobacillus crispatus]TDM85215.1 terminase small subunit [Lactobacillus crispatus]TDM91593.1 terminase small subunit [Lactobacillus crispatus]